MLHPNIPENAELVPGKDDAGKQVTINSCGGALVNVKGKVAVGPYTHQYLHKFKVKPAKESKDRYGRERVKYKEALKTSAPIWLVLLHGYNRELTFVESEVSFD